MQIGLSVIFALFAAAAARQCGTPEPSVEHRRMSAKMALEAANDPSVHSMAAQATLVIDTYFHVIQSGTSLAQGNIPDSQLANQVRDLDLLFSMVKVSFFLLFSDSLQQ